MENKKMNKAKVLLTMLLEEIFSETGINFYNEIDGNKVLCNDEIVCELLENKENYEEFIMILTEKLEEKIGELKNEKF